MRKLASISNIAWPADADDEAIKLAAELGFSGIELAPSKVFGPLDSVSVTALQHYRDKLNSHGLAISALQAILFGVSDSYLFRSQEARARLAQRLSRVAEVAGALGAQACVFGSPSLRDPGDLEADKAMGIAAAFFTDVAPHFAERGTLLAFEANPPLYGCRFVTGTSEAIALVEMVASPGFGLQLDVGTVLENSEELSIVEAAAGIAAHCHASEPGLVPLEPGGHPHKEIGDALARGGYRGWVSVEMRATEDWRTAMQQAAKVMTSCYSA